MEAEAVLIFFFISILYIITQLCNHRYRRDLCMFLKIQRNSNVASTSALNLQLLRDAGGR